MVTWGGFSWVLGSYCSAARYCSGGFRLRAGTSPARSDGLCLWLCARSMRSIPTRVQIGRAAGSTEPTWGRALCLSGMSAPYIRRTMPRTSSVATRSKLADSVNGSFIGVSCLVTRSSSTRHGASMECPGRVEARAPLARIRVPASQLLRHHFPRLRAEPDPPEPPP